MKTLKSTAIVLGLFMLLAGTTSLVRAQDYQDNYQNDGYNTDNVSLQTFYDELSPYGTWIQDPQYGYVWRPDVDQSDFRPYYTNGRWAMTEYGNTWVSNYDWGWAPFHYGRWVINNTRQWIWMPDTNWGPAWVDWRSGDGQYGWAPMAPSININLSFGRRYVVPEFCWNFIPQASIYINSFPRYDYGRNNVYIRNTTIINNTYVYNKRNYYGGPRVEDIRRATNRNVTVYRFDQSNRPGASRIGSREVSIYRPRPERNADNRNAAPRKFEQGNAGFNRGGRDNNNTNRPNGNANNNRPSQQNDSRRPQVDRGNLGRDNNQPNRGDVYNRNSTERADRINSNGIDQRNRGNSQDQQRSQQIQQQRTERNAQNGINQDQQRVRADQQRAQQTQERTAKFEQQRAQRDAQANQQRSQQADQQRAQQTQEGSAQFEQQRAQRDAQANQQRSQQADQQRAQQAQQRSAQVEQQRAQRDAQANQQRSQQAEQQRTQQAQQQQRSEQAQQQRAQQQQQRDQQRQQRVERPAETRQAPPQQNTSGERSGSEGGRPSRGGRG
ncbi:DUF6600 domain-containing protein [Pedobacter mucosus]|uniref:DUF6600 domain-containing protein n=1 Tax=Pedobacter mucosus TaxID=2895286 RepID=UPI001EE4462C|nr:DUF6600 domain-containing protein [Pedobacter mucosus]UKT63892.1 hypothetical protein LOK61_19240 [Pedobacter mucosus]